MIYGFSKIFYWAANIPVRTVGRLVANSLTFGLFADDE
jgi:hypothetical protein